MPYKSDIATCRPQMLLRPSPSKTRSRRLRKKLRIGEFQEFGFELFVALNQLFGNDTASNFLDDLIDEVMTPNGLSFGGGIDYGYITLAKRGSATEEHIERITTWLGLRKEVKSFKVGALQDAWYPALSILHST